MRVTFPGIYRKPARNMRSLPCATRCSRCATRIRRSRRTGFVGTTANSWRTSCAEWSTPWPNLIRSSVSSLHFRFASSCRRWTATKAMGVWRWAYPKLRSRLKVRSLAPLPIQDPGVCPWISVCFFFPYRSVLLLGFRKQLPRNSAHHRQGTHVHSLVAQTAIQSDRFLRTGRA